MHDDLEQRKAHHLDLALGGDVEPGTDPLYSCVQLVHCALPQLALSEIDLSTRLCGVALQAPFMVLGMTGGTERAGRINRELAQVAQELGVAFGVGSMRAVLEKPDALATFDVRPARPPLLLANLGAQQLVQTPDAAERLIELLGADGICIHLNPAQELVQSGGDRDFRGCLEAIGALAQRLGERLIVKETGCGISPQVALALATVGVRAVDVSGTGGTSWTRVEELRATAPRARELGALLSSWGLPSATALGAARAALDAAGAQVQLIASGGIRSGLDAARALALGADAVGMALPLLRAHQSGGIDGAIEALASAIEALRAICLLTGSRDLAALRRAPRLLAEPLAQGLQQLAAAAPVRR